MGMSASQARLLSITSRLTNNEFRSQTITNSKLRLAEKSEEASQEYMDALSTQQLLFGVYDDNGNYTTEELTPAVLYDYSPLKNQYALVNNAGKILVSNTDANNYEKSSCLSEFLKCYGLTEDTQAKDSYENDMKAYEDAMTYYTNALGTYYDNKAQYDKDYADWKEKYDLWLEESKKPDLYSMFSGIVGTSETVENSGAQGHYYRALQGNASCYLHVLNEMLYFDGSNLSNAECTTTSGQTFNLYGEDGGMMLDLSTDNRDVMSTISGLLGSRYCDGDDDFNTEGKQNLLQIAKEEGRDATELEILRSDYLDNGDGTYSKKTLEQKAIDMYYIIKNRVNLGITTDDMNEMLMNFTDGDMKNLSEDPGDPPDMPTPPVEPKEPEKPQYTITINDKDKGQWYTNLWYYMNGSDTANKVTTTTISYNNIEETINTVEDCDKSGKSGTYEVFEDMSLYKSSEWLQFALEHGMISMKQATYNDPATDSGKVANLSGEGYTWSSIIYTSATDITSQDDDVAIAIAEAKYKRTVTEIENKDTKYDQDLKNLDTEHSALQTEYDSIKDVISKNVERSFKAFS